MHVLVFCEWSACKQSGGHSSSFAPHNRLAHLQVEWITMAEARYFCQKRGASHNKLCKIALLAMLVVGATKLKHVSALLGLRSLQTSVALGVAQSCGSTRIEVYCSYLCSCLRASSRESAPLVYILVAFRLRPHSPHIHVSFRSQQSQRANAQSREST